MTSKSIVSASKLRALVSAIACIVALGIGAEQALAKNGVVVLDFSGPRAARLRRDVSKALRGAAKVIPSAKYNSAKRRLRARRNNARDVRKVARSIGAEGVLSGQVSRRRGRYQLRLRLREGATGEYAETITINLGRAPRLTAKARRELREQLVPAIRDLPALGRSRGRDRDRDRDDDDDEIIDTEGEEIIDDEIGEEDVANDDVAQVDDEDPIGDSSDDEPRDAPDDDDDADKDDAPAAPANLYDHLSRNRGIDVAAGLSVTGRSFAFDVAGNIVDAQQPNGYDGAPVPGAYVRLEVYPLLAAATKANPGLIDNFGVTAMVDYVFGLSSQLQNDMMGVEIPTSQLRWGVGAVFRYNIGDSPTSPSIKLAAGYNKLAFELDKAAALEAGITNISLPNVDYTYIDAGADLRYPLSREGAVYAGGRLLVIQDVGEIADLYGSADVSGFDVEAGYEHRLNARLLVRGGARFQSIGFTFTGDGPESDRDGDDVSDVSGASDSFFGGYLTAGYLF